MIATFVDDTQITFIDDEPFEFIDIDQPSGERHTIVINDSPIRLVI